jgi:hypothetical protein
MPALRRAFLRYTEVEGTLPCALVDNPSLVLLSVSGNPKITGSVPACYLNVRGAPRKPPAGSSEESGPGRSSCCGLSDESAREHHLAGNPLLPRRLLAPLSPSPTPRPCRAPPPQKDATLEEVFASSTSLSGELPDVIPEGSPLRTIFLVGSADPGKPRLSGEACESAARGAARRPAASRAAPMAAPRRRARRAPLAPRLTLRVSLPASLPSPSLQAPCPTPCSTPATSQPLTFPTTSLKVGAARWGLSNEHAGCCHALHPPPNSNGGCSSDPALR